MAAPEDPAVAIQPTRRFKITDANGLAVSYLKRTDGRVGIWFPGSVFYPPRRGQTPSHKIIMSGAALYPEHIAKGWLKSLAKDGHADFKMVEEA